MLISLIKDMDQYLFGLINDHGSNHFFDVLMPILSSTYTWIFLAVPLLLGVFVPRFKHLRKFFIVSVLAITVTDVICSQVLKPTFKRLRPCHQMEVRSTLNYCGGDYGFPSNHAANSMALYTTSYLFFHKRNKIWGLGIIVFLIGYSRIYLGVHFLSDILFGFFMGGLIGFLTFKVSEKCKFSINCRRS